MDVMMRRRELMGMQGRLKTVSGPIVTVNDALARNAKSLVVNFTPIQAAGTPAPDNVLPISGWTGVTGYRTGVNLWDGLYSANNKYLSANGELTNGSNEDVTSYIPIKSGQSYYIAPTYGNYSSLCWYDANKTYISGTNYGGQSSKTVTAPDEAAYMRATVYKTNASSFRVYLSSDSAQPYTPYSGTTYPVTFPAVGANLLDESEYVSGHSYFAMSKYSALVGQTIKLTLTNGSGVTVTPKIAVSGGAPALWQGAALASGSTNTYSFTLTSAMTEVNLYLISLSTYDSITQSQFEDCKLMLSTSSTSYEPFDNTVYGGYVDLVSGVLVADYGMVDLGTLTWKMGNVGKFYATDGNIPSYSYGNVVMLCSQYAFDGAVFISPWYGADKTLRCYRRSASTTIREIYIHDESYTDVDAFSAAMNGVQLVCPLLTPITYQLTPQTIAMLRGTNNVWSNANGNVSLTYYAQ